MKFYVYVDGILDLDKMRSECLTKQRGSQWESPCDSSIHFHKPGERCNDRCENYPAQV